MWNILLVLWTEDERKGLIIEPSRDCDRREADESRVTLLKLAFQKLLGDGYTHTRYTNARKLVNQRLREKRPRKAPQKKAPQKKAPQRSLSFQRSSHADGEEGDND